MSQTILGATLAIALLFAIPTVAGRYGPDVGGRFLEKGARYDTATLHAWVEQHPNEAQRYAFPVLFPLDFLLMCSLAGFASFASLALAERIPALSGRSWVVLIVPLAYLAADFVEDALLSMMLTSSARITPAAVSVTYGVTLVKLVTAMLLLAQTGASSVLTLLKGPK